MRSLERRWNEFWFAEGSPRAMAACRAVVAASALWIVLSRPFLGDVFFWPAAFWRGVSEPLRVRFLLFAMSAPAEALLYVALVAALLLAAVGIIPRLSCLLAAVLLYRLAPLENVFTIASGPHFRGLTTPVLVLVVLAFAKGRDKWPLMLARVLVAWIYVSSGIAKLRDVGLSWISAEQIRLLVQSIALPEFTAPWADLFARNATLAGTAAVAGLAFDFLPLLPLFRRQTSWFVLPILVFGHFLIWQVFGVAFLSLPLLLLFLPWEGVDARAASV